MEQAFRSRFTVCAEGARFSLNPSACPVPHSQSFPSFLSPFLPAQTEGRAYFPSEVSGKAALASSWVWIRMGCAGVRAG